MFPTSLALKHDGRLVAEIRRTNPTAKGSPISYPQRSRNVHHEAAQGRSRGAKEWQAAMEALILVATRPDKFG
jgi:hypothetical protein